MVGDYRGGSDWQLLPKSIPSADAKEFERVCRAAAGISPVPPAEAGPPSTRAGPGQQRDPVDLPFVPLLKTKVFLFVVDDGGLAGVGGGG